MGRTCLAVGAQLHLVEPLGFRLDAAEVRRAGLDYWPRVQPRVWPSWDELEPRLAELGEPWFFTAEAPRTFWDVAFPEPAVLLFGRESVGLAPAIRERWTHRLLSIPMRDGALRSVNLSTCVGVATFEVRRQWRARSAQAGTDAGR